MQSRHILGRFVVAAPCCAMLFSKRNKGHRRHLNDVKNISVPIDLRPGVRVPGDPGDPAKPRPSRLLKKWSVLKEWWHLRTPSSFASLCTIIRQLYVIIQYYTILYTCLILFNHIHYTFIYIHIHSHSYSYLFMAPMWAYGLSSSRNQGFGHIWA